MACHFYQGGCKESAFHMVEIPSTIVRPNTLQVDYRSHAFELFHM